MRPSGLGAPRLWMILVSTGSITAGMVMLSGPAIGQRDSLPPITGSTLDEVERYLEMRLSEDGRPGLAAVIVHEGKVVSSVELGEGDPSVAMTVDTPLFIASVSKSITAMALMQQVEVGRVDLDDPVTVYLPELEPEGSAVTVRDLLHHRSGLSTFVGNEPWSGESGSSLEDNIERLGPHLKAEAPHSYSNANYDALALIVQRASGKSFGDYVATEVFSPLGMDDSFVGPNEARQDVASGHYRWMFLGYRPFDQPTPPGMTGSADMFSTAKDLARFVIVHLRRGEYDGDRVVSEESVEQLHTSESFGIERSDDYPVDIGYAGGLWVDASFAPDVDEELSRMVTLFHTGGALGYRAVVWMIPEVDLGFVALTNGNDLADQSWLPQVAQGVKFILFGLDPPDIEVHSPFLLRYGKQMLLALVAVQLILAGLTIRAFRGLGQHWLDRAVIIAASIIDLIALGLIFYVIPATGEAPLRVVLQAPDYRILILAMSAGVLWGLYRTYVIMRKRSSSVLTAEASSAA